MPSLLAFLLLPAPLPLILPLTLRPRLHPVLPLLLEAVSFRLASPHPRLDLHRPRLHYHCHHHHHYHHPLHRRRHCHHYLDSRPLLHHSQSHYYLPYHYDPLCHPRDQSSFYRLWQDPRRNLTQHRSRLGQHQEVRIGCPHRQSGESFHSSVVEYPLRDTTLRRRKRHSCQ